MTDEEKKARIEELTRTIVFANGLGVRAEVCNDAAQREEAQRIYREAKDELDRLEADA
jgi:hypothetical protein